MEKKFEAPEAIIITFEEEDIIRTSAMGPRFGAAAGDEWQDIDL